MGQEPVSQPPQSLRGHPCSCRLPTAEMDPLVHENQISVPDQSHWITAQVSASPGEPVLLRASAQEAKRRQKPEPLPTAAAIQISSPESLPAPLPGLGTRSSPLQPFVQENHPVQHRPQSVLRLCFLQTLTNQCPDCYPRAGAGVGCSETGATCQKPREKADTAMSA